MKMLMFVFSLIAMVSLSSFTEDRKVDSAVTESVKSRILVAPNQDVLTAPAQQMLVFTIYKAVTASENPCSGSCVCESWVQYGQVWYRRCGCYWGGDFWFEKKECGYCPPVPSWGLECQYGS